MLSRSYRIMKGIQVAKFGGPDVLKYYEDLETPQISEPNHVLVDIKCAGVNPVDTYIRSGVSRRPPLPYIPGTDGAGQVLEVGSGVSRIKAGDRVFVCSRGGSGTYASCALVDETSVYPLADRMTFEQGASLGIPYFTAWRALLLKANGVADNLVLVHGASGAVGLAAVQIAKALGMKVIGTAGTSDGMELVKQQGADYVFNHKDRKYLTDIMSECGQVDIVLEMLANVNLGHDLELLNRNGRVVVIGSRGEVKIDPRNMMGPESMVVGCALMTSSTDEWMAQANGIMDGIASGWLNPVVDRTYPIEQAAQVHKDIIDSKGAKGNLVLTV